MLLSSPASGQLAPGVSGFAGIREASNGEGFFAIREFGRCVAAGKRADSIAWLKTSAGSAAETAIVRRLFAAKGTKCLRDLYSMRAPRSVLRGAVAEALYKADRVGRSVAPVQVSTPVEPSTPIRSLSDFATCYVRTHPADVRGLVEKTVLGSAGERVEVTRLAATFGECLPDGISLKISAVEFRVALVEALYHADSPGAI